MDAILKDLLDNKYDEIGIKVIDKVIKSENGLIKITKNYKKEYEFVFSLVDK